VAIRISKNRVALSGIPLNLAAEVDVASATTTSIGAALSNNIRITGTTTITSLGTADAGITRNVRFSGALTLTYNATSLILPGSANITTVANDTAEFLSLGSGNWFCKAYNAASGVFSPTNTYTVGRGGKYAATEAGLQAAVVDALTQTQFTSVALTGTATRTLQSKTVTGSGTSFLTQMRDIGYKHIAFGTAAKFYPVKSVASATTIRLVSPAREATASGLTVYAGLPNIQTIEITEDVTVDTLYINSLGTSLGSALDAACIEFRFRNGAQFHGKILSAMRSGILIYDGLRQIDGLPAFINQTLVTGDEYSCVDHYLNDVFVRNFGSSTSISGVYPGFFAPDSGTGRVFCRNSFIETYAYPLRPKVDGEFYCSNSTLRVFTRDEANPSADFETAPLSYFFCWDGADCYVDNTRLHAQITTGGNNRTSGMSFGGIALAAGEDNVFTKNHTAHFSNVTITGEVVPGSTVTANDDNWSTIKLACDDSDIILDNVKHRFIGEPIIRAYWKNIREAITVLQTINNRFWIRDSQLGKMPSDWTFGTLSELIGDQGSQLFTLTTGTLDTNELDPLRASTFRVGPMTGAVTIPSPNKVGPAGHRIKFIFTEDDTAGHAVTWNAVFKFGTIAWANSTATTDASKVSNVEFESNGTNYYRISPQNEWI